MKNLEINELKYISFYARDNICFQKLKNSCSTVAEELQFLLSYL